MPRLSLPAALEPSGDGKSEVRTSVFQWAPYRQNGQSEDHADGDVHDQQGVVHDDGEAGLQQEVM